MIYANDNGAYPSLLVEDGETVTITARDMHETGILRMRPRTTAALLVLAGSPPSLAPRLSDRAAFEPIERDVGLVDITQLDEDGRIAGYSVGHVRTVLAALDALDALDALERTPPRSIKRVGAEIARS